MGFAELITRRPLVVVVLWLVVAAAAFPLFASLSGVVEEKVYTLPESSESMRALELLEEVRGPGSESIAVLVVDGIDLTSNDTVLALMGWAVEFNTSVVGRYVSRVESFPLLLVEANRTLYEKLYEAVNTTVDRSASVYRLLEELDDAWNRTLANITTAAQELNRTAGLLVEADRAYAEAYNGLYRLALGLNKTITGLRALDEAYANATKQARLLLERLNETLTLVHAADGLYALVHRVHTQAKLLEGAFSNESLVCSLSSLLGYYWWQVSRTHYYMALTGSYEDYARLANLTVVDEKLAPLPRQEAIEAYSLVEALVNEGYSLDNASMAAALQLARRAAGDNTSVLLSVLAVYWLRGAEDYAHRLGASSLYEMYREPPLHVESQLQVLQAATNVSQATCGLVVANASRIVVDVVAKRLVEEGLPPDTAWLIASRAITNMTVAEEAELAASILLRGREGVEPSIVAEVLVRHDPGADGVLAVDYSLGLAAATDLLVALGAPRNAVEKAAQVLLENPGTSLDDAAAATARMLLEERLPGEARSLLEIVTRLDPSGEGLLSRNKTLLAATAASIVYEQAAGQGLNLSKPVVEELATIVAERGVDNETIASLALDLVAREAVERGADREAAEWLRSVLARYDPGARGVLASNTSLIAQVLYERVREAGAPLGLGDVEALVRDPEAAVDTARRLFLERVVAEAPLEARELISRLARVVVEEGPGIPPGRAWEIVEELMLEAVKDASGTVFDGFEAPSWLPERLVRLSVAVARGEMGTGEAVSRLSRSLLLSVVTPRLLNETRGLLVARDYTAFTVILSPLGGERGERAENTVEAARLAEQLLSKHGLRGRVYASGEDLLLEQVRSYAVRDAERAARLSELGTFIVLLLLLGSLMAALLPYLGVILGLVAGGAVVYLAASHGLIDFSSHTQSIMTATALGLGADYAGYLVHRFREEYARSRDARIAARRALERAGPAIVASALTVMIGFGSLLLAWDISFLRGFGQAVPIAVAATAAATLTLVPAVLSMIGGRRWFWWPRRPRSGDAPRESRLMALLVRHKGKVVAAMLAMILVSGYFYATFQGTHDMKLMLPPDAPALEAAMLLTEKFEAGIADPIYIVLVLPSSIWEDNATRTLVDHLVAEIESLGHVGRVISPLDEANGASGGLVSGDGRLAVIQVILSVDPYSREGVETVRRLHSLVHEYTERHGVEAYVGGTPYAVIEMDRILTESFYTRVIPAAAILMITAFTLVFGGLPASIAALLVIIGAAMAGITLALIVFQQLIGVEILWFLHIVSLAAVMGVGMDYNSFFLARALEEYRETGDPDRAVIRAAGAVGRLIVGLSLVVTVAYLALVTTSNTGMREMGFTLAVTVLLAGVMASYLLTPLVTALLGKRAWWPWGLKRQARH